MPYFVAKLGHFQLFLSCFFDYVSVAGFALGWFFFIKKMKWDESQLYGRFLCNDFGCSGCDDWLDSEKPNRKVKNFRSQFFILPYTESTVLSSNNGKQIRKFFKRGMLELTLFGVPTVL